MNNQINCEKKNTKKISTDAPPQKIQHLGTATALMNRK